MVTEMVTEKWYVNDNFVSKKLNGDDVIAECDSHKTALEIAAAHNLDFGAKQIVEYKRFQLHVKNVLTPQDLRDIVYAAMPYTANIAPEFFHALVEEVIDNQGGNLARTKADIKADYF